MAYPRAWYPVVVVRTSEQEGQAIWQHDVSHPQTSDGAGTGIAPTGGAAEHRPSLGPPCARLRHRPARDEVRSSGRASRATRREVAHDCPAGAGEPRRSQHRGERQGCSCHLDRFVSISASRHQSGRGRRYRVDIPRHAHVHRLTNHPRARPVAWREKVLAVPLERVLESVITGDLQPGGIQVRHDAGTVRCTPEPMHRLGDAGLHVVDRVLIAVLDGNATAAGAASASVSPSLAAATA